MEELIRTLPAFLGTLSQVRLGIVHGDLRLDNVVFDPRTFEARAVLDWELCTAGTVAVDVASCVIGPMLSGHSALDGVPSEDELLDAYGRDQLNGRVWAAAVAFQLFRIAAILQGVHKRKLEGNASQGKASTQTGPEVIASLASMALERLRVGGTQGRL